jgi:hypothetical protein
MHPPERHLTTTNPDLVAALDQLEIALPKLVVDYPVRADFWDAFASSVLPITDSAIGSRAAAYAQGRLVSMLRSVGKIRPDLVRQD